MKPFLDVWNTLVMVALVSGCASATISNGDHNATGGQPATGQSATGGENSTGGQSTSSDAGDSDQSQCTWPKEFNFANPLGGGCSASRAMLQCEGSNGTSVSCTGNDLTQCPDLGLEPTVTYSNCVSSCTSEEYVLACGSTSPGNPPSNCRFIDFIPAGVIYYCCPCGT